ncbi:anaerobic sulfatase maturase [Natronospora cellulosivora (SeqCode)]
MKTDDKINNNEKYFKAKNTQFPFNVMAFPNGPICNLKCEYCYYLDKSEYYQESSSFKMSYELLEEYTKQYIQAQPVPYVNFGWQGGEPTLRGLEFFKKAVELQEKYLPEGWQCQNSFQTNATLLNDEWCRFLSKNNFLIGVSIDGPEWIHNYYRKDKKNKDTHQKVLNGIELLKSHNVDFNILCVVNDINSQHPIEVYNFFKEIGAEFIQFIPIVEVNYGENKSCADVLQRSVTAEDYGSFLITIFEEWVRRDFAKVFVQIFEEAVAAWVGQRPGICIFSETCGKAAIMEYNGDVYSCDHFVYPEYKIGNLEQTALIDMVQSEKQHKFGQDKLDKLPQFCLDCKVHFICHGGCPKNRIITTPDGELNYLCAGYKKFFNYIENYCKQIVANIKKRKSPNLIMKEMRKIHNQIWDIDSNDPCSCGSGRKYKKCCQQRKNPRHSDI